jgi:error-prone DNA polymerase
MLPPPLSELKRWENWATGLNLRRQPLDAYSETLRELGVTPAREIRALPDGTKAMAAGVLECLQAPPTRSGALVHFLLTEDSSGLLQSTIFEGSFRKSGHILYETTAYLLHGRVEQDDRRGFSFLVESIQPLSTVLAGREAAPTNTVSASETFGGTRRRNRRAG